VRTLYELSGKCDQLGYDEFCNGAGVGKWGIENGNASFASGNQVDLICSNTETADYEKLLIL